MRKRAMKGKTSWNEGEVQSPSWTSCLFQHKVRPSVRKSQSIFAFKVQHQGECRTSLCGIKSMTYMHGAQSVNQTVHSPSSVVPSKRMDVGGTTMAKKAVKNASSANPRASFLCVRESFCNQGQIALSASSTDNWFVTSGGPSDCCLRTVSSD